MEATKLSSPHLRTALPVPTWPTGVKVPSGEDITGPYYLADTVRRQLGLGWDDMARLHDTGKLPLERRHGHLVVHEEDALEFCTPDELSDDTEELWDEAQAKGIEPNTVPVLATASLLCRRRASRKPSKMLDSWNGIGMASCHRGTASCASKCFPSGMGQTTANRIRAPACQGLFGRLDGV